MAVQTGTFQVVMPAMGDSVAEGTILEWHKQEGDSIAADETLVEISTDKVDAEVPAPVSGTVVKIYAAEGETVTIGAALAEIAIADDDAPSNSSNGSSDGSNGATPPQAESEAKGETIEIVTPAGGESVTEGTILEWSVKVGDQVADGQTIVEVSTDKVDMELPAPAAGTITELLVAEGDTVTVGQVIARMVTGAAPTVAAGSAPSGAAPAAAAPAAPAAANGGTSANTGQGATPVAQRVAAGLGVNLGAVAGSARGGRVTKDDVLTAAANVVEVPEGAEKLKGGAAALARYMDESRSIPTATSFRTLAVSTLDARRKQLKDAGQKVSFTHLIAYAIAKAATDEMPAP